MELFDTYEHAGLTVELHYDTDGGSINPREDWDHAGIIVSFTREIDGDKESGPTLDADELTIECPACGGSGYSGRAVLVRRLVDVTAGGGGKLVGSGSLESMETEYDRDRDQANLSLIETECATCEGGGVIDANIEKYLKAEKDAAIVLPLYFADCGSSGCQLYESDTRPNMAIYLTTAMLQKEWDGDREKGLSYLKCELDEYTKWLNGEVYGYVIKDAEGNDLPSGNTKGMLNLDTSCWGFIGEDTIKEAANEAAESCAEGLAAEAKEASAMADRDIMTIGG